MMIYFTSERMDRQDCKRIARLGEQVLAQSARAMRSEVAGLWCREFWVPLGSQCNLCLYGGIFDFPWN